VIRMNHPSRGSPWCGAGAPQGLSDRALGSGWAGVRDRQASTPLRPWPGTRRLRTQTAGSRCNRVLDLDRLPRLLRLPMQGPTTWAWVRTGSGRSPCPWPVRGTGPGPGPLQGRRSPRPREPHPVRLIVWSPTLVNSMYSALGSLGSPVSWGWYMTSLIRSIWATGPTENVAWLSAPSKPDLNTLDLTTTLRQWVGLCVEISGGRDCVHATPGPTRTALPNPPPGQIAPGSSHPRCSRSCPRDLGGHGEQIPRLDRSAV